MSDGEESQSSDDSNPKSTDFKLEKRWVISSRGQKWVPQCKQDMHKRDYIQVGKFDRSFVKFCLGKGMVVGKRSANVPAFDKLLENRKAASVQAVNASTEDENKKKRKVRPEDESLVAGFIHVELEEFQWNGQTHGGYSARALWGLDKNTLWIELTNSNLGYLKAMVSAGQGERGRTRPWKSEQSKAKPKKSPSKKLRRMHRQLSSSPSKHKEGGGPPVQGD